MTPNNVVIVLKRKLFLAKEVKVYHETGNFKVISATAHKSDKSH